MDKRQDKPTLLKRRSAKMGLKPDLPITVQSTTEEPTVRLATLKPFPFINILRKELDTELSRPIEAEQPEKIYEIEDTETATLFSAIAWQGQKGSTLLLVDKNPEGMVQKEIMVNA